MVRGRMAVRWLVLATLTIFATAAGLTSVTAGLTSVTAAETPALMFSERSDRGAPLPLEGAEIAGKTFVFVSAAGTVNRVRFWLDDPERLGAPRKDERNAPWDFAGTAKNDSALPFDTTTLADGAHVVTAVVEFFDGTSQVLQGRFSLSNSVATLTVTPASLDVSSAVDGPVIERPIQVMSGSTPTPTTMVSDRPWLAVSPNGGSTPVGAVVRVDPTGLSPGGHTGRINIESPGYTSIALTVTLTVGGGSSSEDIQLSSSETRSPAIPLERATVKGDIFVFLAEQPELETVRFWLDDPAQSGSPYRTENSAPYDLTGGTVSTASPFRTTNLSEGSHTVTAQLEFTDQTHRSVSGTFVVANQGPSLMFSPARETATVSEDRPQFELAPMLSVTSGAPDVQLDSDVGWLSTAPCCALLPETVRVIVEPSSLSDGRHLGTVTASAEGYAPATYTVELIVAGEPPTQVHLAYVANPMNSVSVVWRTQSSIASEVEFRPAGQAQWSVATGATRPFSGSGVLHEVSVPGLQPGRAYEYRVPGDGTAKSPVRTFRTAPSGPADFDVVYLADTGIAGRTDGLTTGTNDVVQAVAAVSPLVVLPGGDYAYFDSDKRFSNLDDAIDAWFRQVEPFAANAPMMPTYGNHEVLLKEGYAPWAARFPTPAGFDSRRNYSFDIGPVHFVSVFAVYNQTGLTSSQLNWLRSDLAAAKESGRPWIVPYMHVSVFADGVNHPSNVSLRRQLGPLFEQYDVDLVLASHDQSYERTWPLVDVPASNQPTSTRTDCVSKDDGVTWVKISPAGKLSNKNHGFSQWVTNPPPPWTAVRSNTEHHFGRLHVDATGGLRLDVIGLAGNGAPSFLVDTVRFAPGAC